MIPSIHQPSNPAMEAWIESGVTSADDPRIARMSKMFEPTTFAIAMSSRPRMVEITEATISGRVVPAATIVRPMARSERPA